MLAILIIFLAIALGGVAIGVILGYAKPWGLCLGGLVSGSLYFMYLESWANYDEYIIEPAIETFLGQRVPGVWEYVSMYSVIVFAFMIFAFIYNIIYSWYNDGLIQPFIEYADPRKAKR